MKKMRAKKIAAAITALSLLASAQSPFTASAVNPLISSDFEKGIGLPWYVVEYNTAALDFDFQDGSLNVKIINPGGLSLGGESRWDAQLRARGFKIIEGHKYRVKFEVSSDTKGEFYVKIGNLLGDIEVWNGDRVDGQKTWTHIPIAAGETIEYDVVFTADTTLDAAEWAFHFGGDGQYAPYGGCFPAGTKLFFDNLSLTDLTETDISDGGKLLFEEYDYTDIAVNQLGYLPSMSKQATFACKNGNDDSDTPFDDRTSFEDEEIKDWILKNSDGEIVKEGKTTYKGFDADSGNYTHIIDFSDYNEEGTGYYLECNGKKSHPFDIGENIYSNLFKDSLNFFYQNRNAGDVEAKYITSGDKNKLSRSGFTKYDAYIQTKWVYSYSLDGSDIEKHSSQDVMGGWNDFGDYSKRVNPGASALWKLQNLYEKALAEGNENRYADGTLSLPESENGISDILDEARIEMEWLFKMRVQSGEYKDMVYAYVSPYIWTGLGQTPAEAQAAAEKDIYRIIKPPSTSATLSMVACAAQAYRLWKDIDSDFANECLEVAKASYAAALKNPEQYIMIDQNKGSSFYSEDLPEAFYWAEIELFLATGDEMYLENAEQKEDAYLNFKTLDPIDNREDAVYTFVSRDIRNYGTYSLLTAYKNGNKNVTEQMNETALSNLKKMADSFLETESEQAYGVPLKATEIDGVYYRADTTVFGYPAYSNSYIIDNAMALSAAYSFTNDEKYASGASSAMDYILGRNPLERSYVTGYGEHATKEPHSLFWANSYYDELPEAPSGVLVSGPASRCSDPYIRNAGYLHNKIAPQCTYIDDIEAWSVNEYSLDMNASLAWMAASLSSGSGGTFADDIVYGDIDGDGKITGLDIIKFLYHFLNEKLEGRALISADVTGDGKVNLSDLATLKQFLTGDNVPGGRLVR